MRAWRSGSRPPAFASGTIASASPVTAARATSSGSTTRPRTASWSSPPTRTRSRQRLGRTTTPPGSGRSSRSRPALGTIRPACDVWLIATGAEERPYTGQADHLGALAAVPRVKKRKRDLRFVLSLDEVGRGTTFHLRSARYRSKVEGKIVKAGRGAVRWIKDAGSGNSDHREFTLAGLPAAKLGVPDEPCRHTACDTPDRLQPKAFTRVRAIVERLLR